MSESRNIDWPGLLKWSLEYTDGTTAAAPRPKEDLEFLQAAIESYFGSQVDVKKAVAECLEQLKSGDVSACVSGIASLVECLDIEPELARSLDKYDDLLPTLQKLLTHQDSSVREKVAEFLALALPNNKEIQHICFSQGMLRILMDELTAKRAYALPGATDDEKRYFTKMMSVVSALVKHEPNAEKEFLTVDGPHFCRELLKETDHDRLKVKLESMLQHIDYILSC